MGVYITIQKLGVCSKFFFQHLLRNDTHRNIKLIFRQIQIECVFWKIFDVVLLYSPWHRPLLAQPGPWREAIHCAFLSSFICSSILLVTCLLLAASLAAGVIRPTLAKVHKACALTAHVETSRRYCPTMVPRRCSDSCLPVERQMWATLASAQVCMSA